MMSIILDYVDHALLNEIFHTQRFDDIRIAKSLKLPRTIVLDRLESLIKNHYVYRADTHYYLTDQGKNEWVPLAYTGCSLETYVVPVNNNFNWDYLYIPRKGWDRD